MIFAECLRWIPDGMPESTDAVVVVSSCGTIVKRLEYKKWNEKNKNYSTMKEHIYRQSTNRGKQVRDSEEKIKKYGMYKNVCIRDVWYSTHKLVALAFIKNTNNLDSVDHINGIRDDNRVENLEWVTNSENVKRAWRSGQRDVSRMRKLPDSEMDKIMLLRKAGLSFEKIGKKYSMRGESIRSRVKKYEDSNGCKK